MLSNDTYTLFVCVTSGIFWCRKDWRNWFNWKVKIDIRHPLWDSGCTQTVTDRVAIRLILGGWVTLFVSRSHIARVLAPYLHLCNRILFTLECVRYLLYRQAYTKSLLLKLKQSTRRQCLTVYSWCEFCLVFSQNVYSKSSCPLPAFM